MFSADDGVLAERLRAKVLEGWRHEVMPNPDDLVNTNPDAKTVRRYFERRPATAVNFDDLEIENEFPLHSLTPRAIRYYLQCYLLLCLDLNRQIARARNPQFNYHPQISHFCYTAPQLCRLHEQIGLTRCQTECVCAVVEFLHGHCAQYNLVDAYYWAWDRRRPLRRALRCYRRRLAQWKNGDGGRFTPPSLVARGR